MGNRDLEIRLAAALAGTDACLTCFPKATASRIEGWNDAVLQTLRSKTKFPITAKDRGFLKQILIRFYNFYCYGIIDTDDTIVGVVSDAVASGRTEHGLMWKDDAFADQGFYSSPRSTPQRFDIKEQGVPPQLAYVVPGMTKEAKKRYASTYAQNSAKAFQLTINGRIDLITSEGHASENEIQLVRLTSFLALTLWRAATENANRLNKAFLNKRYRFNLASLAGWSGDLPFSPPCTSCVEKCVLALQRTLPTTSSMFIMLASEYVDTRQPEYPDPSTSGILSEATLMDTAYNGLGLLKLLEQSLTATGLSWTELMKLSYIRATADSWDLISSFYKTYGEDKLQFGYKWARIINDGFLRDYSPKEALALSGVFAGIIEQQQGSGIWNAEWAKGRAEWLSNMRLLGKVIFEDYNSPLTS